MIIKIEKIRDEHIKEFNRLQVLLNSFGDLDIDYESFRRFPLNDSLEEQEIFLKEFAAIIREKWLIKNYTLVSMLPKSPNKNNVNDSDQLFKYKYERCLNLGDFEFIGNRRSDNISNFSLFYSSGMNAILALFLFFQKLYSNKVINTYFSGGYFETIELLKTFPIFHVNYNTLNNDDEDLDVNDVDILYIEPIKYNFSFSIVNLSKIITQIKNKKTTTPLFIVFDSTLLGNSFQIIKVVEELNHRPDIFIINLRSTLKLDQEGLELANNGLLEFFGQNEVTVKFQKILLQQRGMYGLAPRLTELYPLNFSTFLNNTSYSKDILDNNRDFYIELMKLKIKSNFIDNIIYPSSKRSSKYFPNQAPFIIIKLKNITESQGEDMIQKLLASCGSVISERESFGFRNNSIEYFRTLESSPKHILKISIGVFKGWSYYKLLDILKEVFISND